jgi:Ca-activated chloride channel family protein
VGSIRPFALIALAVCAVPLQAPAQSEPVLRVQVNLVRLLVTVKNAAGGIVSDLNRDDFALFDNGVKQEVAFFEHHNEQPLWVSVLIDNSGSTGIETRHEVDSVVSFLSALLHEGNPSDSVALYSFNWQVVLLSSFTRRVPYLERQLRNLKWEAGTSMYDAVWLASRDLDGRDGRHVMVIVTDGDDTTSSKDFNTALQAAQFADTVIYPVVIVPVTNDAGRSIGGEHALATYAQRTGGRIFTPSNGPELEQSFTQLIHELRTQYLVGYYPRNVPPTSNPFHTVAVKLSRPGLRAITRTGYYGDAER